MPNAGSLVFAAAVFYGTLLLGLYLVQERLFFLPGVPGRELVASPQAVGLRHEDVWLTSDDGVRLHAWYLPADAARATLLFLHGNAGNISHRLESLRLFNRLGLSVLILDYRGYGRSEGTPGEEGLLRDARAGWDHLVATRGETPERIVVFGRSMGAAVAAALAAERRPAALVLESGFTSVPDLAAQLYWWAPARRLAKLKFATREALATVRAPVLIIHSVDDELVPFAHGEALYAAAGEPRALLRLRGDHNSGFLTSGRSYVDGLAAFLDAHVPRYHAAAAAR